MKKRSRLIALLLCLLLAAALALTACGNKDHGSVIAMEVGKNPTKLSYMTGELFDPSGMELVVQYEDGYVETVTDGFTWDITDPLEEDDDEIIVRYRNKSILLFIDITVKVPTSLEVETPPDKLVYTAGERFDKTGLTLKATYEDGTEEIITEGFRVSPSGKLTTTVTSVKVTFNRATVEIPVQVNNATPVSLKVTSMPTKLVYNEGELFDPAGLALSVTFSDGSTREAAAYDYSPKGELTTDVEKVTVTYENLTAEIPIEVNAVALRISVTTNPTKIIYNKGENFDPTGMVVTKYENGEATVVDASGYTVSGGENLQVGSIVKVSLNGQEDVTATVPVNVSETVDLTPDMVLNAVGEPVNRDNIEGANTVMKGLSVNNTYLGNFIQNDRLTVTFDSLNALKATVSIRAASTWTEKYSAVNQYWPMIVNDMVANKVFQVYVNGVKVDIADDVLIFGGSTTNTAGDVTMFAQYSTIELANVDLKSGENIIEFVFLQQIYKNAVFGSSRDEEEGTQLASITADTVTINAGAVLHDHVYGDPVTVREATCVSTGKMEQTCSVCGAVKPIAIPKLDHTYGEKVVIEATCANEGSEYEICTMCGHKHVISTTPASEEHTFVKYAVIVEDGVEKLVRSCACGEVTEEVAASGNMVDLKAEHLTGKNTIPWASGDYASRTTAIVQKGSPSANIQKAENASVGKDYITRLYGGSRIEVPLGVTEETTGSVAVKASSGWINRADWNNSNSQTGNMQFNLIFKVYVRHADESVTEIPVADDVVLTGSKGDYTIMANWQYVVFDNITMKAGDVIVFESLMPRTEDGRYVYWDGTSAPVAVADGSCSEGNSQSSPNVDTVTIFTHDEQA